MNRSMIALLVKIVGFFMFSKAVVYEVNAQSGTSNLTGTANELQNDVTSEAGAALNQSISIVQNQFKSLNNENLDNADDVVSNLEKATAPLINQTQDTVDDLNSAIPDIKDYVVSQINAALDDQGIESPFLRKLIQNAVTKLLDLTGKLANGLQEVAPKFNAKAASLAKGLPALVNKTEELLQ